MNHMEFAAQESTQLSKSDWERWVEKAEKLMGNDLDGDQATDGYSLDYAYDHFQEGYTPEEYITQIRTPDDILTKYGPNDELPGTQ